MRENGTINSYVFSLDGQQRNPAKALTNSDIDKINVKEGLDLLNNGIVGTTITSELFNPTSTTGGYSNDSQTRHIYNSDTGVIISKNVLAVGSDLRNYSSFTGAAGDDVNGPEFTLINHSDLDLAAGESVVGVRRTISGYSNTGFEVIISGAANSNQKRILTVDNDGTPILSGANSTISPTDLRFKLIELNTGIDLDGDGTNGFSIAQSDLANQGLHNELNRKVSLTDDNDIILSRDSLPTGDLNSNNLGSNFTRYDSWNGPGVIVLAEPNGDSTFKKESTQTILGARVIRREDPSHSSPPIIEGAEIFVSSENKTKVLRFDLDGTNSGIATYSETEELRSQPNKFNRVRNWICS